MFDRLVSTAQAGSGAGAVGGWARVEAAACARRLAAMVAILDARHAADGSAERETWYLDNWGAVCAEIAAAQQITSGVASNELLIATVLRDRLPKVAARFADGLMSYRVVSAITWRTALITDPETIQAVDAALASAVLGWEPMSQAKMVTAIDYWVHRFDPHALRRCQRSARSRSLDVHGGDGSGLASVRGSLFAHDAEALDSRLGVLADTVCAADPRTRDQRRADAVGALAVGADRLRCQCGAAAGACSAAGTDVASQGTSVVYVITHEDTLTDDSAAAIAEDAALDGTVATPVPDESIAERSSDEALQDSVCGGIAATRPGATMSGRVLAGPLTRRAALGAVVRRILHPGSAPPEPRYRPSRKLAEFVRCRDLTCRFPGCDQPASHCDLDHTIPWPMGPTLAANLKCLCRRHHLVKTFWGGNGCGWRDRQAPDGTVEWTSPTGQTYITRPGSRLLFPSLCLPTASVSGNAAPAAAAAGATRGPAMPRRRRTRAEDRARRIESERQLNTRGARLGRCL